MLRVLEQKESEDFRLPRPDRITRSSLHRLLKARGIPHRPGGTQAELLQICEAEGIQPMQPAPGAIPDVARIGDETVLIGENMNVPQLRALANKLGAKFPKTAKRDEIVQWLRENVDSDDEDDDEDVTQPAAAAEDIRDYASDRR